MSLTALKTRYAVINFVSDAGSTRACASCEVITCPLARSIRSHDLAATVGACWICACAAEESSKKAASETNIFFMVNLIRDCITAPGVNKTKNLNQKKGYHEMPGIF